MVTTRGAAAAASRSSAADTAPAGIRGSKGRGKGTWERGRERRTGSEEGGGLDKAGWRLRVLRSSFIWDPCITRGRHLITPARACAPVEAAAGGVSGAGDELERLVGLCRREARLCGGASAARRGTSTDSIGRICSRICRIAGYAAAVGKAWGYCGELLRSQQESAGTLHLSDLPRARPSAPPARSKSPV
jgi:hypothetical protein